MADRDFRIDLLMRAQFDQAKKALDDADRKLGGIGKTIDGVNRKGQLVGQALNGVAIGITAAATAATAVMGLYIARTIEAEKVQAQLQSRVKDTGAIAGRSLQQLNEQASKLQDITVFDDEAIGNAQAMLLTFTQIRGVNFDRTIEAATNLATVMNTDLSDAAKTLGKALSDPAKGLDQLRKSGITFTDAQREQIQKMVEAGQIAEAQKVILDKLQATMGTAAAAARDTLGGALQALKNSFDNLLEGQSGDAGIVGTRSAIEELIRVLKDPQTKAGFDSFIGDLVRVAGFAVKAAAAVGGMAQAVRDAVAADSQKSYLGLLAKRAALEDDLGDLQSGNPLRRARMGLGGRSGQALTGVEGIQAAIKQIDELLAKQKQAEKQALANQGIDAAFNFIKAPPSNPAPEGQGVPKPPKATGSKADPDADIKRRIASLTEETALLGQIKDGEDKASEAAKARYAITEGEFKNKSSQLKAQLLAAAEALDQKNADVEAEKKRKEAIEASKKAYDDLLQGLRTPAEVAVDDAIAKLDTLNKALQDGIATKGQYDQALGRITAAAFDKPPEYAGLSPEVGGPFSDLTRIDQARSQLEQWYQEQLAKLADFRAKRADLNAQWDAQELQVQAQHQAALQQLQAAQTQVMLAGASSMFGSLAGIAKAYGGEQSKTYRALFALSKGFAVAQAAVALAQNVAEASKYGFPQNIAFIAGAFAQGAQIASLLSSANYSGGGGYAEGGYTGPGGKYEPAGIVHRGEGVLTQGEIAALGGPGAFYALRNAIDDGTIRSMLYGWAGYADGGLVGNPDARPALAPPDWARYPQGGLNLNSSNRLSLYNLFDMDALAQKVANHPAMEKRIIVVASENGAAISSEW